jgi:hypothetical protein
MRDTSVIFRELDFSLTDTSIDSKRPVEILDYPVIHKDDLEPVSIIQPDLEHGPWIAGGACLQWYQEQSVGENDIDVFCSSAAQARQVIDRIKSYGRFQVKYESDNAVTIQYNCKHDYIKSWTLQIITRRFFNSVEDVINNFDISVCEVGTGGQEWIVGNFTARDIRERNLRFKLPLQPDAAKRMVKYWVYGYRPVDGVMDAVRHNPIAKWKFTQEEEYNNAF